MKRRNALIIGLLLVLILGWSVLSLNEFYADGQAKSLWFYFKTTSSEKVEGLIPFLIPAAVMLIYELFIKKQTLTEKSKEIHND